MAQVTLISNDDLQSSLLKDIMANIFNTAVYHVPASALIQNDLKLNSETYILDMQALKESEIVEYLNKRNLNATEREIIINLDPSVDTRNLFVFDYLAGIFYNNDDIETLKRGLTKIISGEKWFSREFSSMYIDNIRLHRVTLDTSKAAELTAREREVIDFLFNGKSNSQIAKELLLSENTVKTHLHNIYKKIKVKNRLEAVVWARQNVTTPPLNGRTHHDLRVATAG